MINPINTLTATPVVSGPAIFIADEDVDLVITNLGVADVDVAGDVMEMTLTVTQGVLTLSSTQNLVFVQGDGVDDAAMVFTGDIQFIQTALNGLTYRALNQKLYPLFTRLPKVQMD